MQHAHNPPATMHDPSHPINPSDPSPRDVVANYSKEQALKMHDKLDFSNEQTGFACHGGRKGIVRMEGEKESAPREGAEASR